MSIIHDALKRVQQGLAPKTDVKPPIPSTTTQGASPYLYETPPEVETLPHAGQETSNQKPPILNKIKSFFALACALAVTVGSIYYLYQQFQYNIPQVQRLAKKSFYQLIHKEEVPDFKNKKPEDLKPLAQITINPSAGTSGNTSQAAAGLTLNIHGIMSNATGNLVLINDQVYQEGDEVDGAKIIKINLDSITVNINGTEKTIFVKD